MEFSNFMKWKGFLLLSQIKYLSMGSPEVSTSCVSVCFLCATKQLKQNSLFDVFIFVDGWSDGSGQALVDVLLLTQLLQQLQALWRKPVVFSAIFITWLKFDCTVQSVIFNPMTFGPPHIKTFYLSEIRVQDNLPKGKRQGSWNWNYICPLSRCPLDTRAEMRGM